MAEVLQLLMGRVVGNLASHDGYDGKAFRCRPMRRSRAARATITTGHPWLAFHSVGGGCPDFAPSQSSRNLLEYFL